MRWTVPLVGALVAMSIAEGQSAAQPGSGTTTPPRTVQAQPDGTASPPPAPMLQLRSGGRVTRTALESFCRPRPDGNGMSCAITTPSVGTTLPRFSAAAGRRVVVDTRLNATSARVQLLSRRSSRVTPLRVTKRDSRHWQFAMPGRTAVALVVTRYADGGESRARASLHRR